jgi:hypothetical protein
LKELRVVIDSKADAYLYFDLNLQVVIDIELNSNFIVEITFNYKNGVTPILNLVEFY